MLRTIAFVFVIGLICVNSCSGSSTARLGQDPGDVNSEPGLLLPAPNTLTPHGTSATLELPGSSFVPHTIPPNLVSETGEHGLFEPQYTGGSDGLDDLAFALYVFDLEGTEGGRLLDNTWEITPDAGDLWIGLANFERNAWDWYSATPDSPLLVPELLPYTGVFYDVYVVIAITGTDEAELTQLAFIGDPPVAQLTVDPDPAMDEVPITVDLDATGSTSPNGAIIDYAWDFDGDGFFGATAGEATAQGQATPQFTRTEALSSDTTVRITDEAGLQARAAVSVIAYSVPTGLGDMEHVGWDTHIPLLDADGLPAMVYAMRDAPVGDECAVKFIRALDEDGDAWGTPVEIGLADMADGSPNCDAMLVDGRPAVLFGADNAGNKEIHYYRADDAQGANWPAVPVVAAIDWRGNEIDMEIVDGRPAFAAAFEIGGPQPSVGFVRASDATGSSWGAVVEVEPADPGGCAYGMPSLAIVDGNPGVVFNYQIFNPTPAEAIRYRRASAADGSAWGAAVDMADVQAGGTLALVTEGPGLIFLYTDVDPFLMWVSASDAAGDAWDTPYDILNAVSKATSGTGGKRVSNGVGLPRGVTNFTFETKFGTYAGVAWFEQNEAGNTELKAIGQNPRFGKPGTRDSWGSQTGEMASAKATIPGYASAEILKVETLITESGHRTWVDHIRVSITYRPGPGQDPVTVRGIMNYYDTTKPPE